MAVSARVSDKAPAWEEAWQASMVGEGLRSDEGREGVPEGGGAGSEMQAANEWGFGPIAPGFSPYFLTAHAADGGSDRVAEEASAAGDATAGEDVGRTRSGDGETALRAEGGGSGGVSRGGNGDGAPRRAASTRACNWLLVRRAGAGAVEGDEETSGVRGV